MHSALHVLPIKMYFDYPLEQGLRQSARKAILRLSFWYFDYPLEQGLRQDNNSTHNCPVYGILIIH